MGIHRKIDLYIIDLVFLIGSWANDLVMWHGYWANDSKCPYTAVQDSTFANQHMSWPVHPILGYRKNKYVW